MSRKIILFILLLSFSFSSGLFALEIKNSISNIEVELLVENENSEKEKDKDKEEYFFETTFMLNAHLFVSILPSIFLLDEFTLEEPLFRPPIV